MVGMKMAVSEGNSKNWVRKIKSLLVLGRSLPQFILELRCFCELFRERKSSLSMPVGWCCRGDDSEGTITTLIVSKLYLHHMDWSKSNAINMY
jgi:hypothetical protein